MTWAEIRKFFEKGAGETTAAAVEAWEHLTQGYRELASSIDQEELYSTATLTVPQGDDNVSLSTITDLYAIYSVFNQTSGERVDPEVGGMRGRGRYLEETTNQPPEGTVYRWARHGGNLWVRDTADVATTLYVTYKILPAALSDSDASSSPVVPEHLHWPIVYLAIANYFALHPEEDSIDRDSSRSVRFKSQAYQVIQAARQPEQEENEDRREAVVQWGYEFS